jgi:hypothetical protein
MSTESHEIEVVRSKGAMLALRLGTLEGYVVPDACGMYSWAIWAERTPHQIITEGKETGFAVARAACESALRAAANPQTKEWPR